MAGLQTDTWHLENDDGAPHKIQKMKGTDFITLSVLPLILRVAVFLCSFRWSAFSFRKKKNWATRRERQPLSVTPMKSVGWDELIVMGSTWASYSQSQVGSVQVGATSVYSVSSKLGGEGKEWPCFPAQSINQSINIVLQTPTFWSLLCSAEWWWVL